MLFKDLLGKKTLFFDGAMGTMLQAAGLKPGELPELWNFTHADEVEKIHTAYLNAGADIIKTNTFGANRLKFAGTDIKTADVITQAVKIAQKACLAKPGSFVALDLGPIGKLLAPYGDLPFEEAVSIYAEIVRAGVAAGADLILIETMSDTYEMKAALLAAKENSDLPVVCTMTLDEDGKLLTGGDITAAAIMLEGLGADAIGFNCGLGPAQMQKLLPQLLAATPLPAVLNPNAGLPKEVDGKTVFDVDADEFAALMYEMAQNGVLAIMGGCCGTTPAHIAALAAKCRNIVPQTRECDLTAVAAYGSAVVIGKKPVIIGERINPTGKPRLKQAILDGDYDYICRLGLEQIDSGAAILDVNVGVPGIEEPAVSAEAVQRLQAITSVPLQIDTSNYEAMAGSMRLYNGKPLLNSVCGKEESLAKVLPLVKKYGAAVVALTLDDSGIPAEAEGRIAIAEKIIARAAEYGIAKRNIIVDPLALTISTGGDNAKTDLQVLRELTKRGIKTVMGVSNISFGLPARDAVNSAFFVLAMEAGLSCAIINPQSAAMMGAYYAYGALSGLDEGCKDYVARFADSAQPKAAQPQTAEYTLYDAIVKGLREQSEKAVKVQLAQKQPLEIINSEMIPALDYVGNGFEKHTLFLPQLLMSAEAAKAAFNVIRDKMAAEGGSQSNGIKVVLATVKGDIHDIGKNIVKVLFENYGYQVIDLGKDVPPEKITEAAVKHNAAVVGLSALMTTTVGAMEETIKALRAAGSFKIVCGGAVLTQDYADSIGADFYAPNAVSAVNYANSLH
ncbi:MAG: homocysteine methyltransferase [Phascolarctobacterium sp.]|nr:MAG: homocysteine methyltransferase [Phascolarctobacterium sp.]